MKAELIEQDALGLAEMVREREIQPSELVEMTIERIERINPQINAVIHKMYDEARKTAEKWDKEISSGKKIDAIFSGVPFLLKDLIVEYKGAPFNEGSLFVKDHISKIDTEMVLRQKAAGLAQVVVQQRLLQLESFQWPMETMEEVQSVSLLLVAEFLV